MVEEAKISDKRDGRSNVQKKIDAAAVAPLETPGKQGASKYRDFYKLHDAIHDSASLEEITALISDHQNPAESTFLR